MAATALQIYTGFHSGGVSQYKNVKIYLHTNFDNVAQFAAEILLFLVSENKRPPFRNSTSAVHFDVFDVIGM